MACPFLGRLSTKFVKNYHSSLLKVYGNQVSILQKSISDKKKFGQNFLGQFFSDKD
jgi:hypothetical protein